MSSKDPPDLNSSSQIQNIPCSHHWFNSDFCAPYENDPPFMKTSGGQLAVRIGDFYVFMQNLIFKTLDSIVENNKLARSIVTLWLKTDEMNCAAWWQIVWYSDEKRKISEKLDNLKSSILEYLCDPNPKFSIVGYSFDEIVMQFENMLSFPLDRNNHYRIFEELDQLLHSEHSMAFYNKLIYVCERIIGFLKDYFNHFIPKKPRNGHIVQLFTDQGRRFAMKWQFRETEGYLEERFLSTISEEELFKIRNSSYSGNCQTVSVPLTSSENSANPVLAESGDYCILARDALFELLHYLFCYERIAEKMKKDEMNELEYFFEQLKPHFDSERDSIYFIQYDEIYSMKKAAADYFAHLLNRPTRYPRELRPRAFGPEQLKKELNYHGLIDILPNITDYLDDVCKYVLRGSDAKLATTWHLNAVIPVIQERWACAHFSFLADFLHNQHSFSLTPNVPCGSEPPLSSTKFKNTMWKDVHVFDVHEAVLGYRNVTSSAMSIGPDELSLCYGHDACREVALEYCLEYIYDRENDHGDTDAVYRKVKGIINSWNLKMYIVEKGEIEYRKSCVKDAKHLERLNKALTCHEQFENLVVFSESVLLNTFYIRTFSTSVYNRAEDRRVFAEEAIDVLIAVLHTCFSTVEKNSLDKIAQYQMKWPTGCNVLLSLTEFKDLLEEFDVNKEQIAVVPDIEHASNISEKQQIIKLPGVPIYKLQSPTRQDVMHISMAHFHIFQSVVCDVDWNREVLQEPENSKEHFKAMVIEEMKKLGDEGVVAVEAVEGVIEKLKEHPNYQRRRAKHLLTPFIKLYDADFNDTISLSYFQAECRNHGIQCFPISKCSRRLLDCTELPAWKARLLFLHFWMDMFFKNLNEESLERNVLKGLLHKLPLTHWSDEKQFMAVILSQEEEYSSDVKRIAVDFFSDTSYFSFNPSPVYHSWLQNESWRDRKYIKRCEVWDIRESGEDLNTKHLEPISQQRSRIAGRLYADERKPMAILEKMIGELTINEKIRDMFRDEDMKFFGTENQGVARRRRDLKYSLRYKVKATKKPPKERFKRRYKKEEAVCDDNANQLAIGFIGAEQQAQQNKEHVPLCQDSAAPVQINEPEEAIVLEKLVNIESGGRKSPGIQKLKSEPTRCDKCLRISERCNNVTKERDAAIRREEKLKKKLEACQKANEKLREQMQGMVPKEELEAKIEELDEVVKSNLEKEKQHRAQLKEWEERLQEANSTIDRLTKEKSKVEAYNTDTHRILKELRNQLSQETLASLDIRMSLEVRDVFYQFFGKEDNIISTNPIEQARKKVVRLQYLTEDPDIRGRAEYDFVEFKTQFHAYEKSIKETITFIRNTPLLTKPEIPPLPEEPDLHPRFYTFLRAAQEAKNEELENECMICKNVDNEWISCPGCKKRFGFWCLHGWFEAINRRTCPHCHFSIP